MDNVTDKWYYTVNGYCAELSERHGVPLIKVAAMMSVLSPNVSVKSNMNSLELYLETRGNCTVSTYSKQKVKADDIYNSGDDITESEVRAIIGKGLKTLSFFENIYRPDTSESVTVDLWMVRWGVKLGLVPAHAIKPTVKQYREISNAVSYRAKLAGVQPHELQARIWVEIRGNAF